jgi:TPP-dependent pyruvate/acetoin dehydrogenase alpha subunit
MTLANDILLEMQRRMLRIRLFDERASKMVKRGEIPGSVHTSIGQEAKVVGACMAFQDGDTMTGNHRSHGHPIVFLRENNQYVLSTPAHTVTAGKISDRATGFNLPGVRVEDGQSVLTVYEAVRTAVDRARAGIGPSLVEVMTYRFNEHSEGLRLAVDYRNAEEKASWLQRDPVKMFRSYLLEQGVLDDVGMTELEAEIAAEIDASVQFANDSPYPEASVAFKDIYTEAIGAAQ